MNKQRVFGVLVLCGVLTGVCYLYSSTTLLPLREYFVQPRWKFRDPRPADVDQTEAKPAPTPSLNPPLHTPEPNPPSRIPETNLTDSNTPLSNISDSKPAPSLISNSSSASSLSNIPAISPPSPTPASHLPVIPAALGNVTRTPDVFKDVRVKDVAEDGTKLKIILYWNDAYGQKHFGMGFGREPFLLAGCPVNTCLTTGDRGRYPLTQVDAVLWHFRAKDRSLPRERSPHTRYVFWMMESASYLFGDLRQYNGVFNWTFTYRLDSDIPNPYGRVYRRRQPLPLLDTPRDYAASKTKMAAWFVSNCHTLSGREKLVKELKHFLPVDIYGRCGSLKCERSVQHECQLMVERDYKFYLSFENSLCKDYVTEKFYGMLNFDVIPVVWGKGAYADIAPPHSFIDALSFPNVKALAAYLLYLDKNHTAYNEYFRWKPYYRQSADWARKAAAFCDLCAKLHSDAPPKTYNMKQWFEQDSHCQTFSDKDINDYIYVGNSKKRSPLNGDRT